MQIEDKLILGLVEVYLLGKKKNPETTAFFLQRNISCIFGSQY